MCDGSAFIFEDVQTNLHISCNHLHAHHQRITIPFPYPRQPLFFSRWQQVWVRWDLREASICLSQTAKGVEYFLKYLLATCISSQKSQLLIGLCINWMIWGLGFQFSNCPRLDPVQCAFGKDFFPILWLLSPC